MFHSTSKTTKTVHVKANGGNNVPLPPALRNIQGKNVGTRRTTVATPGDPSVAGGPIHGRSHK